MIDVNKALGLEKLFEDSNNYTKLKETIEEENDYVIPGYGSDYFYYHPVSRGIEFYLHRDLAGKDLGVSVHCSGEHVFQPTLDHIISTEGEEHIYSVGFFDDKELAFPVRVVCPDALADPTPGDRLLGQPAAFTENKITITDWNDDKEFGIRPGTDNNVIIEGKVGKVIELDYSIDDFTTLRFYKITVFAGVGIIPVLVLQSNTEKPEPGRYFRCEAVLSMDVAIEPDDRGGQIFARDRYKASSFRFNRGYRMGVGFIQNLRNSEKLFMRCAREKDFTRFGRACDWHLSIRNPDSEEIIDNENKNIKEALEALIPDGVLDCEVMQIVSCEDKKLLGQNAIVLRNMGGISGIVVLYLNNLEYISEVRFVDPSACELAHDKELHALAMLETGMCGNKPNTLYEYLSEHCRYRSDYSETVIINVSDLTEHLDRVHNALRKNERYTFEITTPDSVLRECAELPEIYSGRWCAAVYQGGSLAYFTFIKLNKDGKISEILLSRDGNYLKAFENEGSSKAIRSAPKENVKKLLESFYWSDRTTETMHSSDCKYENVHSAYIWYEGFEYTHYWLEDLGFKITYVEIEDDCIGYACSRKGERFAVYMYAFDKQRKVDADANYFQRLYNNKLSESRKVLIVYLKVESHREDDGTVDFNIGYHHDTNYYPDLWALEKVNGKNILVKYTFPETENVITRFMAAFNLRNLDTLFALYPLTSSFIMDWQNGYDHTGIFYVRLEREEEEEENVDLKKMSYAYITDNDAVFRKVPYIKNRYYYDVEVKKGRIDRLIEYSHGNGYSMLIDTGEIPCDPLLNEYPLLKRVEFLPPSKLHRFHAEMLFDNGERKRYDLKKDLPGGKSDLMVEDDPAPNEVDVIKGRSFTDKIFKNGRIVDHSIIPKRFRRSYSEHGQGIAFVNGFSVSTAELYFFGHPVDSAEENVDALHSFVNKYEKRADMRNYD